MNAILAIINPGDLILGLVVIALLAYRLSKAGILLAQVPQGEIVVIMHSEKAYRFIGNITGHWVHPKTGEVNKTTEKNPAVDQPGHIFGIYWVGIPPFASLHRYKFHWNKYIKKENVNEYVFEPRDETVDSVYFQANYGIRFNDAETKDKVPLTVDTLVTIEAINVDTMLFKVKQGWLPALTGAIEAAGRDFIASKDYGMISNMPHETPKGGKGKTDFQKAILALDSSAAGNPKIQKTFGVKIVSVNFLSYKIGEVKAGSLQEASVLKYKGEKDSENMIAKQRGKRAEADTAGYEIERKGKARKQALLDEADGLTARRKAIEGAPELVGFEMAQAIRDQDTATTFILGEKAMPVVQLESKGGSKTP